MAFTGFPERAFDFYEGLEADNSKAYWTDHKDVYDTCVAGPMKELLAELEPTFGTAKMFRPYRDVRFSKDKTPYKTRQYAVIDGALYVGIDAQGLHLGGGRFHLATEEVQRMRAAVDGTKGAELEKVLAKLRKAGFEIGGEQLKRVPKPYDADHPRADLLKHKALIAYVDPAAGEWLHTADCKQQVVKAWKALAPLNDWLTSTTG